MVWPWLGRAGVFLMGAAGALWGRKKLLTLVATFGGVIVARPEGGYLEWLDEKKDDIIEDAGKAILPVVGAGIGIVLLLVLISSRRGGD